MKKQLADNAERRRQLLEKIRGQRREVAEISELSQSSTGLLGLPMGLIDAGIKAIRFIYSHPALAGGSVAALLALRRKSILGFALQGWRFMYLYPSIFAYGLKYLPRLFGSKKHVAS